MATPTGPDATEKKVVRCSVAYQKDLFSLLQSIATILALIAGAAWFVMQGQSFTKANTTLSIEDRRLPGTDWTLLTVSVKVENVGMRTIEFSKGVFRVAQLVPVPDAVQESFPQTANAASAPEVSTLGWTQVSKLAENLPVFVNAGETEHVKTEFLVPSSWKVVRIYAKLSTTKDGNYWSMTALHDIQPTTTEDRHEIVRNAFPPPGHQCDKCPIYSTGTRAARAKDR